MNLIALGILAWATSIPYLGLIAIVGLIVGLIVALVGVFHLVTGRGRY